jgi:hypothetical protein
MLPPQPGRHGWPNARTRTSRRPGRAVANGRIATSHFRDEIAALLLSVEERQAVERDRNDSPPDAVRERLAWERLQACAGGMAPRTLLIDDAVRTAGHRQLVIGQVITTLAEIAALPPSAAPWSFNVDAEDHECPFRVARLRSPTRPRPADPSDPDRLTHEAPPLPCQRQAGSRSAPGLVVRRTAPAGQPVLLTPYYEDRRRCRSRSATTRG